MFNIKSLAAGKHIFSLKEYKSGKSIKNVKLISITF